MPNRLGSYGKVECTYFITKETATVEFFYREDEERAFVDLNGMEVEGQKLKVEMVRNSPMNIQKKHQIRHSNNRYQGGDRYHRR